MIDATIKHSREALMSVLTQYGAHFKGTVCRCLFHDDKHASAGVYEKEGVWRFKCQTCGEGGDIFDIRAKLEGKALKDVLPRESRPATSRTPPRTYASLDELVKAVAGRVEAVYEYSETFAVVRYIPTGEDKKRFKQVHSENGKWIETSAPKPWPLWNRESLGSTEDPVIVVEGEKCVEALRGIGLVAVTSCGGAGNGKHSDWRPLAARDCVLWPDLDDKGVKHMQEIAAFLLSLTPPARVRMLDISNLSLKPKGDVADLLALAPQQTAERKRLGILEIIRDAGIVSATKELSALIEDTIQGRREAVATPWPWLNRNARPFLPGTITLKCGAPGSGKSFFLLETAHALYCNGIRVAIYMLEEDSSYHLWRLLAQLEQNSDLLDPEWVKANPEAARAALQKHRDTLDEFSPCLSDAPNKQPTIEDLLAWAKQKAVDGCRVIIIDPISVADMGREPWTSALRFMIDAKAIAREYDTSIVVSVHPRKGTAISGLVDLDSVAGGAAFTRLSQTVLWLEHHLDDHLSRVIDGFGDREWKSNRTVHILKARNGPGQGKRLAFHFDSQTLRFNELGVARPKEARHARRFERTHNDDEEATF